MVIETSSTVLHIAKELSHDLSLSPHDSPKKTSSTILHIASELSRELSQSPHHSPKETVSAILHVAKELSRELSLSPHQLPQSFAPIPEISLPADHEVTPKAKQSLTVHDISLQLAVTSTPLRMALQDQRTNPRDPHVDTRVRDAAIHSVQQAARQLLCRRASRRAREAFGASVHHRSHSHLGCPSSVSSTSASEVERQI